MVSAGQHEGLGRAGDGQGGGAQAEDLGQGRLAPEQLGKGGQTRGFVHLVLEGRHGKDTPGGPGRSPRRATATVGHPTSASSRPALARGRRRMTLGGCRTPARPTTVGTVQPSRVSRPSSGESTPGGHGWPGRPPARSASWGPGADRRRPGTSRASGDRPVRGQPELKRFMACSTSVAARTSTASAATSTAWASSSRSALPGRFEHVVGAGLGAGRLAHTDTNPDEGRGVQMGLDGFQPVVAGRPTALLHPDPARRQVELVVHDDQPGRVLDAEAPQQRADGRSRVVHVGAGHGQGHPGPVRASPRRPRPGSPSPGAAGPAVALRPAGPPRRPRRCAGCRRTPDRGCPGRRPAGRPACPRAPAWSAARPPNRRRRA